MIEVLLNHGALEQILYSEFLILETLPYTPCHNVYIAIKQDFLITVTCLERTHPLQKRNTTKQMEVNFLSGQDKSSKLYLEDGGRLVERGKKFILEGRTRKR